MNNQHKVTKTASIPTAYVIGHPIAHSRSPLIHGHWLKKHNIAAQYNMLDVAPSDLKSFAQDVKTNSQTLGANVTIPYKEEIKNLCDDLTPTAAQIGAVNTVFKRDGLLIGDNTDAYGFIANLDDLASGWNQNLQNITILGAGGATRGLIFGLQQRTKSQIQIVNRTLSRAQVLANDFGPQVHANPWTNLPNLLEKTGLLINATSIGMKHERLHNLDLDLLPKNAIVTDIVYTPLETPLLKDARAIGLTCIDGLGMLLHQAVPGFEYWFGVRPQVDQDLRDIIVQDLDKQGLDKTGELDV